ncbi:MAG: MFS transporter [Chloroflexota bacterium]
MKVSADFVKITLSDFIVRSAYQMGKTPLLPIFAASIGATDTFLGLIVSVSTFTGLVSKPLFGIFSDRWGRRVWLLVALAFFVGVPFLYPFVQKPEQLFVVRIVHGFATAIFGPVTLAYIADIMSDNLAESLGWFGMARSGGYIIGPAFAGWLLLTLEPAHVFTLIGFISALAIVPTLMLTSHDAPLEKRKHKPLRQQIMTTLQRSALTPALWLSGGLEASTFIALYTVKAFLPVFALNDGLSVVMVGLFFSVQEAAHVLVKPFGGRLGDSIGHLLNITLGIALLALGLLLLVYSDSVGLLLPSLLTGIAQAFIFPSTVALVSQQIAESQIGAGMGFIGMWQNFGKVTGPVLGGLLISQLGFEAVLILLACSLLIGAGGLVVVLPRARALNDS